MQALLGDRAILWHAAWFQLHRALQLFGVAMFVCGVALALAKFPPYEVPTAIASAHKVCIQALHVGAHVRCSQPSCTSWSRQAVLLPRTAATSCSAPLAWRIVVVSMAA